MSLRKKIVRGFIVIVCLYALLQVVPYGKKYVDTPFRSEERPLIIAHGGAKAMNPENTWLAYEYADSIDADVLEIDLCLTKDGILVTHHNEGIDDLSDGTGPVSQYTYDELKQFNFGVHFKALDGTMPYANLTKEQLQNEYKDKLHPVNIEELFMRYGKTMLYILEIKDDGELGKIASDTLLSLIEKYGLEKHVCVASFHEEIMNYINEVKTPEIVTSFDEPTATDFIIWNYAGFGLFKNYYSNGFQLPMEQYNIPLASKYLIYKIHKNNMFVHYWTINTKEEMKVCIKNGADGIITDRPDLLIEVLEEFGY